MPLAFQCESASAASMRSTRPTISSTVRKPSFAMYWRTCSAMKKKKLMTCSGCPWKRARKTGSCVAMPTAQVFRWHLRIMMQPIEISGMVAKPNSSAPSNAAMVTSRPVCSLPSVCTRMRLRRSLSRSTCWVSARPSSHGSPACLMELSGDAPVPPLSPEISTTSACALETPAATVPTPASATSLTAMRAFGFTFFRS